MRRGYIHFILTAAAAVGSVIGSAAQHLDTTYYDFPLRDVAGYYSANFGEMRPNHFHSGTDIKTDGVEGKPVVAAADGYVSRIFFSPWGYGMALYIAHPNGTTTVYGHLSRFRKDIADYVWQQRHSQRKNRVDLYCKAGMFPVKRGEQIALSGNTGSSGGPHLHFEIRDSRTQKTLNVIQQGVLKPKDNIAPLMMKLHYVEVDTVRNTLPIETLPYQSNLAEDWVYSRRYDTPETKAWDEYSSQSMRAYLPDVPLFSPCISLEGGTYRIRLRYRAGMTDYMDETYQDAFNLRFGIAGSPESTWTVLLEKDTYTQDGYIEEETTFSVPEAGEHTFCLTALREPSYLNFESFSIEKMVSHELRIEDMSRVMPRLVPQDLGQGIANILVEASNRGTENTKAQVLILVGQDTAGRSPVLDIAPDSLQEIMVKTTFPLALTGERLHYQAILENLSEDDSGPEDNTIAYDYAITDSTLAYDNASNFTESYTLGLSYGYGVGIPYTLLAPDTLTSISIGFGGIWFEALDAELAKAMFGIPACKGVEFGDGFGLARMCGSQTNDAYRFKDGRIVTATNHLGGIVGGMCDGAPVCFRVAFKPTPSISIEQQTVNLRTEQDDTVSVKGRHDPCIVPRAVAVVEAMAALTVADQMARGLR